MKKNKMMRIASVLLVAVLLTTSVISGTFAKYVTTGEAGDSARVAKFGVVVASEGKLFDWTYAAATANTPGGHAQDTDAAALTVESQGSDNVVAPGTKSDATGLKLSVTGTPEVDVYVKFSMDTAQDIFLKKNTYYPDVTNSANASVAIADDYYPIVYTLSGDIIKNVAAITALTATDGNGTYDAAAGTFKGTLAQIKAAIDALNGTNGIRYDAGASLVASSLTLTWEWDFDAQGAGTNDKADTLLGDLAADASKITKSGDTDPVAVEAGEDFQLTTSVKISVTVTQID